MKWYARRINIQTFAFQFNTILNTMNHCMRRDCSKCYLMRWLESSLWRVEPSFHGKSWRLRMMWNLLIANACELVLLLLFGILCSSHLTKRLILITYHHLFYKTPIMFKQRAAYSNGRLVFIICLPPAKWWCWWRLSELLCGW